MEEIKYSPNDIVDFVVIGAGAAGGVVAKELAVAGFSVVVLEQGPHLRESDYSHDEIKYVFGSGLTNDTKLQPITFSKPGSTGVQRVKAIGYGRQVGGGSVHFTANYWRFHESDFHERSLFGSVSGADLADWPITYADLEPYYTKAEYDLGISGLAGANPFEGPRSKPYPLPPMPAKSSGVLFERAARKLGLHPFPAPVAILSQPYQGRAACVNCGFCEWCGLRDARQIQHLGQRLTPWRRKADTAKFDRNLTSARSKSTPPAASPEPSISIALAARSFSGPALSSCAPTEPRPPSSSSCQSQNASRKALPIPAAWSDDI